MLHSKVETLSKLAGESPRENVAFADRGERHDHDVVSYNPFSRVVVLYNDERGDRHYENVTVASMNRIRRVLLALLKQAPCFDDFSGEVMPVEVLFSY